MRIMSTNKYYFKSFLQQSPEVFPSPNMEFLQFLQEQPIRNVKNTPSEKD